MIMFIIFIVFIVAWLIYQVHWYQTRWQPHCVDNTKTYSRTKPWKPRLGEYYYVPDFAYHDKYTQLKWLDDSIDNRLWNRNVVFRTSKEAKAYTESMLNGIFYIKGGGH